MTAEPTLLERIGRGDRGAVTECVDTYGGLVWSLARRFFANEADAEESVQEIFMEIWSSAARYDAAKASEATFIAMLARRRLIDRTRRQQRRPQTETLDEISEAQAGSHADDQELSAETKNVLRVIDQLQPEQSQVLRMSAWLGMSHGDIASETGMPLGTVKSYLRRGLEKVRAVLNEEPSVPGVAPR